MNLDSLFTSFYNAQNPKDIEYYRNKINEILIEKESAYLSEQYIQWNKAVDVYLYAKIDVYSIPGMQEKTKDCFDALVFLRGLDKQKDI